MKEGNLGSQRTVFSVCVEVSGNGPIVVKVKGQFVNNRGRRTFNRAIDGLTPGWYHSQRDRPHIIDLTEVTEIDHNGFQGLKYAKERFYLCGVSQRCLCTPATGTWTDNPTIRMFSCFDSITLATEVMASK